MPSSSLSSKFRHGSFVDSLDTHMSQLNRNTFYHVFIGKKSELIWIIHWFSMVVYGVFRVVNSLFLVLIVEHGIWISNRFVSLWLMMKLLCCAWFRIWSVPLSHDKRSTPNKIFILPKNVIIILTRQCDSLSLPCFSFTHPLVLSFFVSTNILSNIIKYDVMLLISFP